MADNVDFVNNTNLIEAVKNCPDASLDAAQK